MAARQRRNPGWNANLKRRRKRRIARTARVVPLS